MKFVLTLFAILVLLPLTAEGARKTNIRRGGQGFLFPDHNSFRNPGQFAISHGAAAQLEYFRLNGSDLEGGTPSFVYGNGRLGFGFGVTRLGNDLRDGSTAADVADVGLGFSMLKNRLTIGAAYSRLINDSLGSNETVQGTLTFNSSKRQGPAVGLGYVSNMSTSAQSVTAGLGYSFSTNAMMEVNLEFADLRDTDNYTAALVFGLGNNWMYFATRVSHVASSSSQVLASRLGFILGRYIDLSVSAAQELTSGGSASYGASLRMSF